MVLIGCAKISTAVKTENKANTEDMPITGDTSAVSVSAPVPTTPPLTLNESVKKIKNTFIVKRKLLNFTAFKIPATSTSKSPESDTENERQPEVTQDKGSYEIVPYKR